MRKVNPNFVIGVTILGGWILSIVMIYNKIEETYQRICDKRGWYWYDNVKHKRIY